MNGPNRQHNYLTRNSYTHRRSTAGKLNGVLLGIEFMWCVAKRGGLCRGLIYIQETPLRPHHSLSDSLIKRRSLVAGLIRP